MKDGSWDRETSSCRPKQTMENIKATLEAAGATFENVTHMDTFYVDRDTIPQSVRVRSSYFGLGNPYTTTGMIVSGFSHRELLIEIDVIAMFDD